MPKVILEEILRIIDTMARSSLTLGVFRDQTYVSLMRETEFTQEMRDDFSKYWSTFPDTPLSDSRMHEVLDNEYRAMCKKSGQDYDGQTFRGGGFPLSFTLILNVQN